MNCRYTYSFVTRAACELDETLEKQWVLASRPYPDRMPRHDIAMHLPPQGIKNLDVEIAVRSDDDLLGTLKISKGSIDWRPAKSTKYSYEMRWEKFASVMESEGTKRQK